MSQFYCVNDKNFVNLDLVCNVEFTENSCELFFVNETQMSFKGKEKELLAQTLSIKTYYGNMLNENI